MENGVKGEDDEADKRQQRRAKLAELMRDYAVELNMDEMAERDSIDDLSGGELDAALIVFAMAIQRGELKLAVRSSAQAPVEAERSDSAVPADL